MNSPISLLLNVRPIMKLYTHTHTHTVPPPLPLFYSDTRSKQKDFLSKKVAKPVRCNSFFVTAQDDVTNFSVTNSLTPPSSQCVTLSTSSSANLQN